MTNSARAIPARLVAFPTTSDRRNISLLDLVEEYLGSHGIARVRVPSADDTKAAHYASAGPTAKTALHPEYRSQNMQGDVTETPD